MQIIHVVHVYACTVDALYVFSVSSVSINLSNSFLYDLLGIGWIQQNGTGIATDYQRKVNSLW